MVTSTKGRLPCVGPIPNGAYCDLGLPTFGMGEDEAKWIAQMSDA
jgi:hypothetical protein